MHSIFPDILFLGPYYAPVLLRIAAALAYAWIAYSMYTNREALRADSFPVIGTLSPSVIMFGALISLVIALGFAAGVWTQGFAILGTLGAIKGLVFSKKHPLVFPGGMIAYVLLAFVCLALLITGAGAYAFDLPY